MVTTRGVAVGVSRRDLYANRTARPYPAAHAMQGDAYRRMGGEAPRR
jgi:hypothetical protein